MASLGFGRALRLRTQAEFKAVFATKQNIRHKYWVILFIPNNLDYPRLGLSVSKKNLKTAVARNRIKRLIRESVRLQQKSLAGFDIVVIVRYTVADVSNGRLLQQINKHWYELSNQNNNA